MPKLFSSHGKAVFLIVVCTLFTSFGQILWKAGITTVSLRSVSSIFNLPLFLGFVSYGLGALFMILAFRYGELSVLYPIIATSYVWVSILSPLFFPSDTMNLLKWGGVLLIVVSVSILGFGRSATEASHG